MGIFNTSFFCLVCLWGCEMIRDEIEYSDGYSYYYKLMNGNSYFWVMVFDRTTKE
jgi:hypothetical protein